MTCSVLTQSEREAVFRCIRCEGEWSSVFPIPLLEFFVCRVLRVPVGSRGRRNPDETPFEAAVGNLFTETWDLSSQGTDAVGSQS